MASCWRFLDWLAVDDNRYDVANDSDTSPPISQDGCSACRIITLGYLATRRLSRGLACLWCGGALAHMGRQSKPLDADGLDLGCGTGTNVITLAENGWQAIGVDFVPRAVRTARRKTRQKGLGNRVEFFVGDALSGDSFQGVYNLILDIGCFHSFPDQEVERYARNVKNHLAEGGSLLLYAHLRQGSGPGHGASEAGLALLGEYLSLAWREDGADSSRPSVWLEFKKVTPE